MNRWRIGTKRHAIANLCEQGKTKREAFYALYPLVISQTNPMVFRANVGGTRRPKSISDQLVDLRNEISRVFAIMNREDETLDNLDPADFAPENESPEIAESPDADADADDANPDDESPDDEPKDDTPEIPETPVAAGKRRVKNELAYFLNRVREIREFCEGRVRMGAPVDSISMRPAQAAAKLIPAGIPADALLHSMTIHWDAGIRSDARIRDFDLRTISEPIADGYHWLTGYILKLAENRQPIMLVGPAGTGKSHIAKQVANYLGLSYGETPMTPGATRGDLLGRHTIGGFIASEFTEKYSGGGVFNFEEIDASDPGMLIVLNNALAQSELFNSANGERYARHEDFIPVSTANTFGTGANREFTGRERLDAATIDRWRMGRVFVPLDEEIEEGLLYGTL